MTQKEFRNWLYLMGFTAKGLDGPSAQVPVDGLVMKNGKINVFIYWESKTTRAYLNKVRMLDTARTPQELDKLRNAIERHL